MTLVQGFSILAIHVTHLEIFEKVRLPRLHQRQTESLSLRFGLDISIFQNSPGHSNVQLGVRTITVSQTRSPDFYYVKLIVLINSYSP